MQDCVRVGRYADDVGCLDLGCAEYLPDCASTLELKWPCLQKGLAIRGDFARAAVKGHT